MRWVEAVLDQWIEAGGDEDRFWRTTPRGTRRRIDAYIRRRAWVAWHAGYPGQFKNPKYDDLLGKKRSGRKQGQRMSPELMAHNLRVFRKARGQRL